MVPIELQTIADNLSQGRVVNPVTVRDFLSWFDAKRRGISIVAYIRDVLDEIGLCTQPDFEEPWIDNPINFYVKTVVVATPATATSESATTAAVEVPVWEPQEASYRLSRFQAATKPVTRVSPDATLEYAATTMLINDFSQLPVMTGEQTVKGVVTWASIGSRVVLGTSDEKVSHFMIAAVILDDDASIFEAIDTIVKLGFVLVRDREKKISGIVTAADLSLQFQALSEPFLLLSEIETYVRNMIGRSFSVPELVAVRDIGNPHAIQTVADLTFGEYVALLQKPGNWAKVGIKVDRAVFCERLDRIRTIRNQVMHFDPDGLEDGDKRDLQEFSSFLKRLELLLTSRN